MLKEVNYKDYVAAWRERFRARESERVEHHTAAMAAALSVATKLVHEEGAQRAYVFGTVLDKDRFRLSSDIDIAVEGLPGDRFFALWAELEREYQRQIELVRLEWAHGELRRYIREHGKIVAAR